ncbi:hypothetical protein VKT23_007749 [Stygiomarasmius scandens]|uniref:Uncharacterized protein n=1 Tax=Marasmiellus scandens TaxID=2682957 RepID=A0ABR1JJ78_9AGAR
MVSLLLTCIFLVTGNSLVRAIYYTVPPSATVGQEFTATWFSPPTSLVQFWLAFPVNDFDVQQNDIVYTVTPNDRGSGTVVLPVPTTTGSFYIGTYSPDLNNVGNSPPILAVVAEGDTSPRSNSPKLSSPTLEPAPSQDESSAGTHVGTSSE